MNNSFVGSAPASNVIIYLSPLPLLLLPSSPSFSLSPYLPLFLHFSPPSLSPPSLSSLLLFPSFSSASFPSSFPCFSLPFFLSPSFSLPLLISPLPYLSLLLSPFLLFLPFSFPLLLPPPLSISSLLFSSFYLPSFSPTISLFPPSIPPLSLSPSSLSPPLSLVFSFFCAPSVMVIVEGNRIGIPISKTGWNCLRFTSLILFWKRMNPDLLSLNSGGRMGFLVIVKQLVKG